MQISPTLIGSADFTHSDLFRRPEGDMQQKLLLCFRNKMRRRQNAGAAQAVHPTIARLRPRIRTAARLKPSSPANEQQYIWHVTDAHTFCKLVEDSAPLSRVFLVRGHQDVKLQDSKVGRFVMHRFLIVPSSLCLQQGNRMTHELAGWTARNTHHLSLL